MFSGDPTKIKVTNMGHPTMIILKAAYICVSVVIFSNLLFCL